jgi:hypothetical protein
MESPMRVHRRAAHNSIADDGVVRPLFVLLGDPPPDERALRSLLHEDLDRIQRLGDARVVVDTFLMKVRPKVGRAAFEKLMPLVEKAAKWASVRYDPEKGAPGPFLWSACQRAYFKLAMDCGGVAALRREWVDERLRARIVEGSEAFQQYWSFVRGTLYKYVRAKPGQWHVPGLGCDDLIPNLMVDLLAAVKDGTIAAWEKPGKAASIWFCVDRKNQLRRKALIYEALPPSELARRYDGPAEYAWEPEAERDLITAERSRRVKEALENLRPRLSRIQRCWLAAMQFDLNCNDDLNLQRVAEQLGRNRSSGSRMRAQIAELLREELGDLIDD